MGSSLEGVVGFSFGLVHTWMLEGFSKWAKNAGLRA